MKFLEELDSLERKRHEEVQRGVLLRAAKVCSTFVLFSGLGCSMPCVASVIQDVCLSNIPCLLMDLDHIVLVTVLAFSVGWTMVERAPCLLEVLFC